MKTLVSKINNELKRIFSANGYDENLAYISISNREELADYQINSCFNIAKSSLCYRIIDYSDYCGYYQNNKLFNLMNIEFHLFL